MNVATSNAGRGGGPGTNQHQVQPGKTTSDQALASPAMTGGVADPSDPFAPTEPINVTSTSLAGSTYATVAAAAPRIIQMKDELHVQYHAPGTHDDEPDWPWCVMQCDTIAERVHEEFGWPVESGFYRGDDLPREEMGFAPDIPFMHWWNRLPDGSVVDASADQFGLAPIRIVPPDDPAQRWYVQDAKIC